MMVALVPEPALTTWLSVIVEFRTVRLSPKAAIALADPPPPPPPPSPVLPLMTRPSNVADAPARFAPPAEKAPADPPETVKPLRFALPLSRSNTESAGAALARSTVSSSAPGPVTVRSSTEIRAPSVSEIVDFAGSAKSIVSAPAALFASSIAWRREQSSGAAVQEPAAGGSSVTLSTVKVSANPGAGNASSAIHASATGAACSFLARLTPVLGIAGLRVPRRGCPRLVCGANHGRRTVSIGRRGAGPSGGRGRRVVRERAHDQPHQVVLQCADRLEPARGHLAGHELRHARGHH